MQVSTITTNNKQVMTVYAAREYDEAHPRNTPFIEINIPEYVPTIPQDDQHEEIGLSGKFFMNDNYPIVSGNLKMYHYLALPILSGTKCPILFRKGTPFLLLTPTGFIEDGYLIYI